MLTSNKQSVTEGYTLGLKDLLESREILFMVTGADKREAYELLQEKIITNNQPTIYGFTKILIVLLMLLPLNKISI